jgi:hypothetical protein
MTNLVAMMTAALLGVLPSTASRIDVTSIGGTTYTFSFKVTSTSHIKVFVDVDGAGSASTFVEQTTGITKSLDPVVGGGVVFAVAPAPGATVRIERTVPVTQDSLWTPYSAFKAKTLEGQLDYRGMVDQQLDRRMGDAEATHAADRVAQAARDGAQDAALSQGEIGGSSTYVAAAGTAVGRSLGDWMADLLRLGGGNVAARFTDSGCISAPVASYNIPMTITRSSAALTLLSGALVSCGANALRVEESPAQGALVESARTNLITQPEALNLAPWVANFVSVTADATAAPTGALTAERITKNDAATARSLGLPFTATATRYVLEAYFKADTLSSVELGIYVFGGVGFQPATATIISGPGAFSYNYAGGTMVLTGLSTTEWTHVAMVLNANCSTVSSGEVYLYPGSAAAGNSGLSLFAWGVAMYASPPAPGTYTATTRAADDLSIHSPIAADQFCVKGRFTPYGGRSWSGIAADLFSLGVEGANPSATLQALTDGTLKWTIRDSLGGVRSATVTHGFVAGSAHDVAACVGNGGAPSIWIDGSQSVAQLSGSGTGVMSPRPTTAWLGSSGASTNYWNGYLYDMRFSNSALPADLWTSIEQAPPTPSSRVLWLSDSIYNMSELWSGFATNVADETITSDIGTYGGDVSGGGLFELADETKAYENVTQGWVTKARGRPFTDYSALVFEFMRNDASATPVAAYERAYDKILAQGEKYFSRVVSGNGPPAALPDFTAWNLAGDFAITNGLTAVVGPLATKWGSAHVDTFQRFQDEVTAARYTVAQLMRDTLHPSYDVGATLLSDWIADAYSATPALIAATPMTQGRVLNYLFGQPTAGTWTLTAGYYSTTSPNVSPLGRVADLPDMARVAQASGAKVSFPSFTCSVGNCQVWAHFLVDSASGGTVNVYVDRGTGSEVMITKNTLQAGLNLYFQAALVADGLAAGAHAIEMETTSAAPVRVVGVTYVGAT